MKLSRIRIDPDTQMLYMDVPVELTPDQQLRVAAFKLDEPEWQGHDDMGEIQPGDRIETKWRGVTITGVADHVSQFGAWYTAEQGLLVPNFPQTRWRRL